MTLTPRTRLGAYEILTLLGAGGMGEVYKARDTRLERTVAIKVLPASLASDQQFRERFDREARTISQLDHPHICTLYDVGEQDGTSFLVMQYLEGQTLEHRLKKGALPINEALTIAIQIADALDKAHRAGIVHRDLKPGNIMLTKSDAKLLDFGLAKTSPVAAGDALSMLPTTPANLTAQGTILGTFQYMAPEQLEGQESDARTDIFSFGAVVYEMLTGKKAFQGKSQVNLITAIMGSDPLPIRVTQPLAPPILDRVVKRCLAKSPDARWQTATDLLEELKWVAEGARDLPAPVPPRASRVTWVLVAVATVAAAVAITVGMAYLRNARSDVQPLRFSVSPPQNVTLSKGNGQTVALLSPDGRRIVFVANRMGVSALWVRSLDALEAQPLPGTEGAALPFWSPDSRTLGFFAGGKVKTIDGNGGLVRSVCDAPTVRGGAWSRDDTIVFAANPGGGLFKVPAAGGQPTPVTTPDVSRKEIAHRYPAFLPDGRHFLYSVQPSNTIWLGSLDSNETTRLLTADSQVQYAAPGLLLFERQGTLFAQPFDARHATLVGDAVPIAERLASDISGYAAFSSSNSGVLAYRTDLLSTRTQLTWVDRTGKAISRVGQPGLYRNPALSPDGTRLALEAVDPQDRTLDVWLMELVRDVPFRLTFNPANEVFPVWSPDGSRIMFSSDRGGGVLNLYQKRANGVGNEELVAKSSSDMAPYSWAPDGGAVVYRTLAQGTAFGIGILPLVGDSTPRLFEQTRFAELSAQISPNGRWLAYSSNETGRQEVYVQGFPAPGSGKWPISKDGGIHPRWGKERELFYYALDGRLMAVAIGGDSALEVGVAVPLFEAHLVNGPSNVVGFRQQYDVSRDGQRFLLNVPIEDTPSLPITVVLNWQAALTARERR